MFSADPRFQTTNFNPGDIGYVLRNNGHYVRNIGNTDLQFLEVFRSPYFVDVSLSDWLTHTLPAMVAATFNLDPATWIRRRSRSSPRISWKSWPRMRANHGASRQALGH